MDTCTPPRQLVIERGFSILDVQCFKSAQLVWVGVAMNDSETINERVLWTLLAGEEMILDGTGFGTLLLYPCNHVSFSLANI